MEWTIPVGLKQIQKRMQATHIHHQLLQHMKCTNIALLDFQGDIKIKFSLHESNTCALISHEHQGPQHIYVLIIWSRCAARGSSRSLSTLSWFCIIHHQDEGDQECRSCTSCLTSSIYGSCASQYTHCVASHSTPSNWCVSVGVMSYYI